MTSSAFNFVIFVFCIVTLIVSTLLPNLSHRSRTTSAIGAALDGLAGSLQKAASIDKLGLLATACCCDHMRTLQQDRLQAELSLNTDKTPTKEKTEVTDERTFFELFSLGIETWA